MRLLKLTTFYGGYLAGFYRDRPALAGRSFAEQKHALDHDAFGWADFWSKAMEPRGHAVSEVTVNADAMQRAWERENLPAGPVPRDLEDIAVAQGKRFRPDVLWVESPMPELARRMRNEVPSLRCVVGFVGSAMPPLADLRGNDIVISCAPESVERLRASGMPSAHLHHAFDSRIPGRIPDVGPSVDVAFVGQVLARSQFHTGRELLLRTIAGRTGLTIFSSPPRRGIRARLATLVGAEPPGEDPGGNWKLPVWGLEMFRVLKGSKVVLNIHADSSPRFASNMRLFETTGMGACLLTDRRENLAELFEPGIEVVEYRGAEECVERVKWLLDHPSEREGIAAAGQRRTLRDHTFAARAPRLEEILLQAMGGRPTGDR